MPLRAVRCPSEPKLRVSRPVPREEGSVPFALRDAARRVLGGDADTASERLRAAIARGDASLFARVAEQLARQAPFDAPFVAEALASLQAEAMAYARANEARLRARNRALAQTARRDSLTGIANRATLGEALATEVRRAQRYGQPFGVLFVDVDHFKRVNDTRGHAAGDRVLQQVSATIARALRPGDVLGRYGGEEFVVGVVNADGRAALRTAERLRRDVERARFEGGEVQVTISIGVATMSAGESVTLGDLLERADRAMLVAKASGRNVVCAWSERQNEPA